MTCMANAPERASLPGQGPDAGTGPASPERLCDHFGVTSKTRWMASLGLGALVVTTALAGGAVCLTSGCSTVGYYAQSVTGHLNLVEAARPVPQWLADPAASPALKARLELSQRIRDYAVSALDEPDNASYRRYADLKRSAAIWNVVAAPELSLVPQTWCFAVVGCVGYRGYYDPGRRAGAGRPAWAAQGLDVDVYPVPAYSTLGRLPTSGWLADPLLNTFIGYQEGDLAGLVFHELAHQIAFAPGDTLFNESFASTVEKIGTGRWLSEHAGPEARESYARSEARRIDFRDLTLRYRTEFAALYAGGASDAGQEGRQGGAAGQGCAPTTPPSRRPAGTAMPATTAGSSAPTTPRSACSAATPISCLPSSASTSARARTSRVSTPKSGASPPCPWPSAARRWQAEHGQPEHGACRTRRWPRSTSTVTTISGSSGPARSPAIGPTPPRSRST